MLIAGKIHEYMEQNYGIKLNRKHFLFGNIKPDLVRKFKALRHSIHDSLDYVLDEMARHENERHNVKNPSVHLGMINHYLSDFFCSKHYFRNHNEGLIKHLRYEGRLHKAIKKMDAGGFLALPESGTESHIRGSFPDILRELEYEYIKRTPSIENDILFALCAPLIACRFLFRHEADVPEALEQAA